VTGRPQIGPAASRRAPVGQDHAHDVDPGLFPLSVAATGSVAVGSERGTDPARTDTRPTAPRMLLRVGEYQRSVTQSGPATVYLVAGVHFCRCSPPTVRRRDGATGAPWVTGFEREVR